MKICVYAICKNEEDNVNDWYESMSEADDIYVLDTGSSDSSVSLLKQKGVKVTSKIYESFRFDVARNECLDLISKDTDIYVCTDLDERFEKGWRSILEKNINSDTTRVKYLYNWSFDENGKPATTFYLDKIHTKNYFWKHPVHEVLNSRGKEKVQLIDNIVLNHYQKEKISRSNYLKLLELSVLEEPNDDRNVHYLGREYMYYRMYDKAIDTLHLHLKLASATWKPERAASYRYIARCYKNINRLIESEFFYQKALDEAPEYRENYVEYAYLLYDQQKYDRVIELLDEAFKIKNKNCTYINESFAWNYQIYELYAYASYYLNKKDIANKFYKIAISLNSKNENLINNSVFFE